MSKVVYVEDPDATEPPQRVWVREEDQPVPGPDDPADYLLDAHHPYYCLRTDAEVRAWMAYMFHPSAIEGRRQIRFI
jgi:hypothetical protein